MTFDSINALIGLAAGFITTFVASIAWDVHKDYRSELFEMPLYAWAILMLGTGVGLVIGALTA